MFTQKFLKRKILPTEEVNDFNSDLKRLTRDLEPIIEDKFIGDYSNRFCLVNKFRATSTSLTFSRYAM